MSTVLKRNYFSTCKAMRIIAEKTLKKTFDRLGQACNNWDTVYLFSFAFYQ